jgi:hypothetical protein
MARPSSARNSAGRFTHSIGIRGHLQIEQGRHDMTDQVIATEDAIVHDDVLGIDRKVFAGQPVPPDLVEAYQGGARAGDGSDPVDYDAESVEELEKRVADRKLEVKGTGKDGNVVKADLVKALQAADIDELKRAVDVEDTTDLQRVADAAETFAIRYTGRLLQPDPPLVGDPPADTEPPVTKRILCRSRRRIRVPDARAITAITFDGTALAGSDWELQPAAPGQPSTGVEVLFDIRGRFAEQLPAPYGSLERPIVAEVTGRFGFLEVPDDLYRAILELAARRLYEQSTGFTDAVVASSEWGGGRQFVKQMSGPVRAVLDSYRVATDLAPLA